MTIQRVAAALLGASLLVLLGALLPEAFYEQYRTDAAFELHRTAPHLAGYRAERKELVARPSEIELYRSLMA